MFNIESILIKICILLDIEKEVGLGRSNLKKLFENKESEIKTYLKKLGNILKKLNYINDDIEEIFIDLILIYKHISPKLEGAKLNKKKINWILLKRLVVPYLAYRMSMLNYNYNNRIDKNLPFNIRFWFLPNLEDPKNIKTPVDNVLKWWKDLYGKGIQALFNEIDEKLSNEVISSNTIKPWFYDGTVPEIKSIQKYCSLELDYKGIYTKDNEEDSLDIRFENAKKFLKEEKQLDSKSLGKEIVCNGLLDADNISEKDKEKFIEQVKNRWAKPSKETVVNTFTIAIAIQKLLFKNTKNSQCISDYFEFDKDSTDIVENKIYQLVHLFSYLHILQWHRNVENDITIEFFSKHSEQLKEKLKSITGIEEQKKLKDVIFLSEIKLGKEYLDPFYQDNINDISESISKNIIHELRNSQLSENELEDIYPLKCMLYFEESHKDLEKVKAEYINHYNYLFKFKEYMNKKVNKYLTLSDNEFYIALTLEQDYRILPDLYKKLFGENFNKCEAICYKRNDYVKNNIDKLALLESFLSLYTAINIEGTVNRAELAETKLEEYEKLIFNNSEYFNQCENDYLIARGNYYLKSKDFSQALITYDKYFEKNIVNKNKTDINHMSIMLSLYSAFKEENSILLDKYNVALTKIMGADILDNEDASQEFFNTFEKSIYFYKKI